MADDEPMETSNSTNKKKTKKGKKTPKPESSVFIPGRANIDEDEELVVDESAYVMLHQATTGDPCLSFEILQDDQGRREKPPYSSYLVGGTQSEAGHFNYILLMKMYNMHKTQKKEKPKDKESDDEEDDESSEEEEMSDEESEHKSPQLRQTYIKHNGCVNRIKTTTVNDHVLAASWSELGSVSIHDVTQHLKALDGPDDLKEFETKHSNTVPVFTFSGHQIEGYALCWSKLDKGRMLSGDCNKNIFLWQPTDSSWVVAEKPFIGHTASVEDIKWSPKENNVFMSCSVDKSLRVWDARANPNSACKLIAKEAHMRDINVIDWSEHEPLIISGGDDGLIKIWDLRKFTSGVEVAVFEHHKGPITSVEWNPIDSSVFVASASDDQISIWDVAVERDEGTELAEEPDVPPQLLFMHLGQKDIKEVHWHPQIPGLIMSTAQSGFNVFKTISV